MTDKDDVCIVCGKSAKFMDFDNEMYCSENCYFDKWEIDKTKTYAVKKYICDKCQSELKECANCKSDLSGYDAIICCHEPNEHFCNLKCYFEHYGWRKIGG